MGTSGLSTQRRGLSYYGGLDGLRALAIIAVLVYHGGVAGTTGGFLGVEAFFVLSGFLITSLLVSEWRRTATIALGAFWARRARRLLPALFLLVLAVAIHQVLAGPEASVPGLKGDGIATLLYFGNWHQIATQSSYFAATGPVSPLQHTWSLAIEEQFYILWPLLFLGLLWIAGRLMRRKSEDPERPLRVMLAVTVGGLIASAIEVMVLFDGGAGLNRVYYGTDTRAVSILTGASLALGIAVFRPRRESADARQASGHRRRILGWAAVLALTVVLGMMHIATGSSSWLYPFGFVGLDLAVAVMIAAVVFVPTSVVGRIFSVGPLRAIGQISYGIYLWHFPIYLWLDTSATGVSGARLLLLRIVVTLLVSVISFVIIEQPIRQRRLPRVLVRSLTPVAAAGAMAMVLIAAAVAAPATVTVPPPKNAASLRGTDPPCTVRLKDTAEYGLSPMSPQQAAKAQPKWLAARRLTWSGSGRITFRTCPPKKALLIGDSLAFSMGLGTMINEQGYGVEVANAAILGCSFTTRGEINAGGRWEQQRPGCPTALTDWARQTRALHPDVVIVELGYRDEFDWRWNGHVVHLGQRQFDAYLQRQIDSYVDTLARTGTKVLFLSVPWAKPPALQDGSPAPAGTAARHALINSMLQSAVRAHPDSSKLLSIDDVVSPGNRFRARVNGQLCRFDGIHFTIYCGQLLQPKVLSTVRGMIGR